MGTDFFVTFNPLVAAVVGVVLGTVSTWLAQHLSSRRGLFTYVVQHLRVGISGSDPTLGTITINWNGNTVKELFLSTIELKNNSFQDYENVHVRVYTDDTVILTDRTEIIGTTRFLEWTEEFSQLVSKEIKDPSEINLISKRRDYKIPTMNRGQEVRFTILNMPSGNKSPTLWMEILHKGIKIRFNIPQKDILEFPTH